jgi:hypothetical protein
MRAPLIPSLIAIATLCAGLSVAYGQSFKPPERRPGYWQTTMALGPRTMSTQMCTDAAFEKTSSVFGAALVNKSCAKQEYHPIAGGWAFTSTCTAPNGGTDVSSGTVTGDFQTSYHMELKTHPSSGPDRQTTMDAKWLGQCPAGRVPGDMVMPGGQVMNLSKMGMPH